MVRHLNHVEERVLEELAWTRDSALWTSLSRKPDSVPTCDEAWGSMTRIVSSIGSPPKKMRYDSGSNTFSQVQFPPCNAQKSFFSKIYYLASVRLSDICERIRIDDRGRRMMWTVLEYILKEERSLFMDRHLDQNLLCIVYVVCKANKADVSFVDIMSHYRHQPQADSRIYRMVRVDSSVLLSNDTICSEEGSSRDSTSVTDSQPLRSRSSVGASPGASHSEEGSACAGKQLPTTPEPDPLTGQHVDLIVYYNKVFLPRVEEFMKKISDNCPLASLTPMPVRRLPRSAPSKRNLSDKETGRSPCPTSSEKFVGFELEEATWPKTEVLDCGGERGSEDTRRGQAVQARRKVSVMPFTPLPLQRPEPSTIRYKITQSPSKDLRAINQLISKSRSYSFTGVTEITPNTYRVML
ncbi:hypothetical protein RB195_005440 [Necator americanus]|uniref:Retinoblastoma-associated protein B domain protein n=1 Tax=Necator americanus TaxID=51031 RepID=A0ABR1BPQ6_NECAM